MDIDIQNDTQNTQKKKGKEKKKKSNASSATKVDGGQQQWRKSTIQSSEAANKTRSRSHCGIDRHDPT